MIILQIHGFNRYNCKIIHRFPSPTYAPAVHSAVLPACWWMVVSPPQDKEPLKSPLNTNQRSQLYMIADFQNRLRNYFLNSDLLIHQETGSVSTKGAQEQFGFVCGRKNLSTVCSCWACCCWPKSSCLYSLRCWCGFSSNVGRWAGFWSSLNWWKGISFCPCAKDGSSSFESCAVGESVLKVLQAWSKNSCFIIALVNWKRKMRSAEAECYNPALFV